MSNPSPTAAATEAATPATLTALIRAAGDEFAATGDLSEVSYAALTIGSSGLDAYGKTLRATETGQRSITG